MMNSQKTLMDQFYRTSGASGGFYNSVSGGRPSTSQGWKAMPPPPGVVQSLHFFKRDSSSDGQEFSEEDEEGEEEEKVPTQYANRDDSF